MLNTQQHQQIAKCFPFLQNVDNLRLAALDQMGTIVNLGKGGTVGRAGEQCDMLALVLSGVVRVYKQAESGRELTLYRIHPGESCVLTASCVLSHSQFPAEAVAESNVMAVMIPASAIRQWITQSEAWRDFVFSLISLRLSEVIAVVDEVAFKRLDSRIAKLLLSFPLNHEIYKTHQEIADELGSAREVVTRVLNNFEHDGAIKLQRGMITIVNKEPLVKLV